MNKKNKFFTWSWYGVLGSMLIFLALRKLNDTMALISTIIAIVFCVYSVLLFILCLYERHQVIKNLKLIGNDREQLIKFCENGIKKYCISLTISTCKFQLAVCHLRNNEIELAKKELSTYKIKYAYEWAIYPIFVLAVMEKDIDKANECYNRMMTFKSSVYDGQKDMAKRIFQMIKTKVYDEKIFNETNYLGIKELCLSYKQ